MPSLDASTEASIPRRRSPGRRARSTFRAVIARRVIGFGVCALVVASCGGAASSTGSLAGSITFMRDDSTGHPQTWVACADLSQQRQLTSISGHGSGWSVWSPDGSRIAIDTDRADPDLADSEAINDVFTMAADGSDLRKLTDSVGVSGDPGWSPDGKLIAFEADRGDAAKQGIYVANAADGKELRRVTSLPAGYSDDHAPRFSPDGKQLLFTREQSDSAARLFVVNLDGSGLRPITPGDIRPGDATWSPDGTQITFEADNARHTYTGAWIVRADGSGLVDLVPEPTVAGHLDGFADPVWSPDGKRIMLLHGIFDSAGAATTGLAIISPDGSGLAYVTDGTGAEHQPDWSSKPC